MTTSTKTNAAAPDGGIAPQSETAPAVPPLASNKVTFGFKNVTCFEMTKDEDGAYEWDEKDPVRVPGTVNLSLSPTGSSSPFYAEDGEYFNAPANTGWEGDMEMANFPDEFYVRFLGWKKDANGALVEDSEALPKPFAMAFEVQGDAAARRTVFFKCTATRPADEAKTKEETISPQTKKTTLKASPALVNGVKGAKATLPADTPNKEAYENFYKSVYKPTYDAAAA